MSERAAGHPPVLLSIAGSDPSGGAGIQADLKTFDALGAYGCAVITALTAQNTRGVAGVFAVPASFVTAQLDTLLDDVRVDAVKIGMVADAEIGAAIAEFLDTWQPPNVVLDPVMVATSGDRLLRQDAERVVREELVPRADLITPNVSEAAVLLGVDRARSVAEATDQAVALLELGARRALLKGGHLLGGAGGGAAPDDEQASDVLVELGGSVEVVSEPAVVTRNSHGTGCTLSSAIAALRPGTESWLTAVAEAKHFLTVALAHADELAVGQQGPEGSLGHGPVNHLAAAAHFRR